MRNLKAISKYYLSTIVLFSLFSFLFVPKTFAEGTGEVLINISPATQTIPVESSGTVSLTLSKNAARNIAISGAEATILLGNGLTTTEAQISCANTFSGGLVVKKVEGQSVRIVCTIPVSGNSIALSSTTVPFATIQFTASSKPASGISSMTFTKVLVSEADVPGQAIDLAGEGKGISVYIADSETNAISWLGKLFSGESIRDFFGKLRRALFGN